MSERSASPTKSRGAVGLHRRRRRGGDPVGCEAMSHDCGQGRIRKTIAATIAEDDWNTEYGRGETPEGCSRVDSVPEPDAIPELVEWAEGEQDADYKSADPGEERACGASDADFKSAVPGRSRGRKTMDDNAGLSSEEYMGKRERRRLSPAARDCNRWDLG